MPVQVTARVDGFRRCGMAHSAKTQTYPDNHFTPAQLAVLENEPQLIVVRVSGDATNLDDTAKQLADALEKLKAEGKVSALLAVERDALKAKVADLELMISDYKSTVSEVAALRDALQESNKALTAERDALQAQLAAANPDKAKK